MVAAIVATLALTVQLTARSAGPPANSPWNEAMVADPVDLVQRVLVDDPGY
jgi:hypothetical protein